MKSILIIYLCLFTLVVYGQSDEYFGKKVKEKSAVPAQSIEGKLGNKEKIQVTATGTVESVCKVKGCWMKIVTDEGKTMRVTFKDYGFFVPKDIAGKTVVFTGEAKKKTTPVDELQHYAKDAGKTQAEIDAIQTPQNEIVFVAEGVILKNNK